MKAEPSPDAWSQVSIVGLGLIGGSMARALRERLPRLRIIGIDRDEVISTPECQALAQRCISERDGAGAAEAFATSDIVFLAAPVSAIGRWLAAALVHPVIVTDAGSTKREIVAAARALPGAQRFVPGHPMAGAGGGSAAASGDLFEGRPWVLCPEGVDPSAFAAVRALVTRVGARPVEMSAEAHDRAVALTSHAPRLVASALAILARQESAFPAAGPAFERLLRGAGGDDRVWADVISSNADELARALRRVIGELDRCAVELERREVARCLAILGEANLARAEYEGLRGARGGE